MIIEAAQEVGPSLFFSLLVITVGFLPVFTLEAQAGRLFKPLAYTKTFAMLFSSFLAVTLTPVLMTLFIRGKIRPEEKNPVSWLLHRLYEPVARVALRFRKSVIVLALIILAVTVYPFMKLGSEFMPPLYEGTLFYMPVTVPAASVAEVGKLLNLQDRIIKKVPEVAQVFGKAGRAETATDPAPLEMFETVINLKPEGAVAAGDDRGEAQERAQRRPFHPRGVELLHDADQGADRHALHGDPDARRDQGDGSGHRGDRKDRPRARGAAQGRPGDAERLCRAGDDRLLPRRRRPARPDRPLRPDRGRRPGAGLLGDRR